MHTWGQIQEHLTGMGHGGTLNKVRNIEAMAERSASRLLARVKPLEVMRTATLVSAVYDDVYNYALPSDFNDLIDLIPQDDRQSWDNAFRNPAGQFDLQKAIRNRTVSIEGNNGIKTIRINWRSRAPKVLNSMNSYNGNGTFSVVGSATGVGTDDIFKVSGGGSVVFTHVASGDGIQNTSMTAVDLTDENQVSSLFAWVYFSTVPTSVTATWGNDLTTKYWTSTAQTTQADGTAFKVGWNLLSWSWAAATQTGTVAPATIDSFKITLAGTALGKVRVDNVVFAIGRNFDIKYYSKFFFMSAAGVWQSRPAVDEDLVLVDNDTLPHYLYELLQDMAQQMEGSDGAFDIQYADKQLQDLYPIYRGRYPSMTKKSVAQYGSGPRYGPSSFTRSRWGK